MNRTAGTFLASFAVALITSSCSAGSTGSDTDSITIGTFPGATTLPLIVGISEGVVEEAGLEVETIHFTDSQVGAASLRQGSVDILPGPASNAAILAQSGTEVRIFCGALAKDFSSVWTQPGSKLEDAAEASGWDAALQELKGGSIGVSALGGGDEYYVRRLLSVVGLEESDVEVIAVGVGQRSVAALMTGEVDALYTFPVTDLIAEEAGAVRVVDALTDSLPDFITQGFWAGWYATDEWLDANTSSAEKVCDALQDSLEFIQDPANSGVVGAALKDNYGLEGENAVAQFIEMTKSVFTTDVNCDSIDQNLNKAIELDQLEPGSHAKCDEIVWAEAIKAH